MDSKYFGEELILDRLQIGMSPENRLCVGPGYRRVHAYSVHPNNYTPYLTLRSTQPSAVGVPILH